MVWALGAPALLFLIWIYLCAPARGRRRADAFRGTAFAHRGLHGPDCPENSRAAFQRACAAGYGIEMDVQITRDGHLVVFHDDDAARMTGRDGLIRQMTLPEVRALRLAGGDEKIPTFDEVLETVAGRVPMLVEIKSAPGIAAVTEKVVARLRNYSGPYVMQSFNPLCLLALRKNAPDIVRGILVQRYAEYRETQSPVLAFFASSLLINALVRPDFIAHAREMQKSPSLWLCKRLFRAPTAQWTIVDRGEREALARRGVMPIFEEAD